MAGNADYELDFNSEYYNEFYYTNEKQIRKMDDRLIVAKIAEKYPEFANSDDEFTLKQVFSVIVCDTKFIKKLMSELDVNVQELFSAVYRKYSFIFNGSYISKIHRIIKGRSYARTIKRKMSRKISSRAKAGKRRGRGGSDV